MTPDAFREAKAFADTLKTSAVLVVKDGKTVAEWGDTAKKLNVLSIRKSFLSALYGIHAAGGAIDLERTLGELGIDDNEPSLTAAEKTATIRMLLQSRSGVYHPALFEPPELKASRPPRGSHPPGTFFYYNNWDFNALLTIFEKLTGRRIFEEFAARIAGPLGMRDFEIADGQYLTGPDSIHPAYPFRMTARDLARFGEMYRNGGGGIVPAEWVRESTTAYSNAAGTPFEAFGGYGYMWWVEEGSFSAFGIGGHRIMVVPGEKLVIVHRVATETPDSTAVSDGDLQKLCRMIRDAARTRL